MRRVLTQVVGTLAVLTTLGAAHGPNTMEKTAEAQISNPPAYTASAAPKHTRKSKPFEVGPASWYGKLFHGKQTASGETYNMYEMTAAHPDLPLGTRVKVTNLRNSKAVIVRVNDRGPLVPGRIIDLSYGAAKQLGFGEKGVQRVRLDIVPNDAPAVNARLQ
jgi:rare lipoprotein A (peptidoglycan hydrolase)